MVQTIFPLSKVVMIRSCTATNPIKRVVFEIALKKILVTNRGANSIHVPVLEHAEAQKALFAFLVELHLPSYSVGGTVLEKAFKD